MLKILNSQNILTTPIIASAQWNLNNINENDLILIDTGSVEIDSIALEYLDYFNYIGSGTVPVNTDCSIALEIVPDASLIIREGQRSVLPFDISSAPVNLDGTYKELVYNQISNAFYNTYKNPLKIFGLDYIDFELSKTYRYISDTMLTFNISPAVFGERIVPNSVSLTDLNIDDNVLITDDGNGNINVGNNIFFKIQEVRQFGNIIYI